MSPARQDRGRSQPPRPSARRASVATLTSTLGAGVLGAGIGVVAAGPLRGAGIALLVVGAVMHGWGMADQHRLATGGTPPLWSTALYWLCWGALAMIAVAVLARLMR